MALHARSATTGVPDDFLTDVALAHRQGQRGSLRLFAHELTALAWEAGGLRVVVEAQRSIGDLAGARETACRLEALDAMADSRADPQPRSRPAPEAETPALVLCFTGHMIDAPDRPDARRRFPPTAAAEATARKRIEEAVRQEINGNPDGVLGIASGACGGDILFHEVCRDLGIRTEVLLALPIDALEVASVQRGGPGWIERYRALLAPPTVPRVLQPSEALPHWLADKADYDVWQRNNLRMLFCALATDARDKTLIALLNREREPDGPGGTAHLIREARARGFRSVELDARELLSA